MALTKAPKRIRNVCFDSPYGGMSSISVEKCRDIIDDGELIGENKKTYVYATFTAEEQAIISAFLTMLLEKN